MTIEYRCKEGDMLDEVCHHYYGQTSSLIVEQVLTANPGLASLGPTLPVGTLVTLPAMTATASSETEQVNLWS